MSRIRDLDGNYGNALLEGEQSVRLLGPFHIAHDDDEIDGDGAIATSLSAGQIVLNAWAEPTEEWQFDASGLFILVWAFDSDPGTSRRLTSYETETGDVVRAVDEGVEARNGDAGTAPPRRVGRITEASTLRVVLDGGPATTGEADIYALIAEPA
jgi:hypothetical protein